MAVYGCIDYLAISTVFTAVSDFLISKFPEEKFIANDFPKRFKAKMFRLKWLCFPSFYGRV